MPSSSKKRRTDGHKATTSSGGGGGKGDDDDADIESLRAQVKELKEALAVSADYQSTLYSSGLAARDPRTMAGIPERGMNARHVRDMLHGIHSLNNEPSLNTSSYVNVTSEAEETELSNLGATVNIADASVYPAAVAIHDKCVDFIAGMWHCPEPPADPSTGVKPRHYSGSGTVGSTEACLLAGLAHKFRWRRWYAKRNGLSQEEVLGVRPNLVMTSCFQAAWEKFFRYFDVEPRFVKPSIKDFRVVPEDMMELCDDKTMAVVGVMGNHYSGAYDPIWEIDEHLSRLNEAKGYQIGIHVDAASGGFIAPFADDTPPWDFRLDSVLSISTSGHKFGESICGTGWVVFRRREDLTEHIAISVSYLGGVCDSLTLNFSRPASSCYVQMYKLVSAKEKLSLYFVVCLGIFSRHHPCFVSCMIFIRACSFGWARRDTRTRSATKCRWPPSSATS